MLYIYYIILLFITKTELHRSLQVWDLQDLGDWSQSGVEAWSSAPRGSCCGMAYSHPEVEKIWATEGIYYSYIYIYMHILSTPPPGCSWDSMSSEDRPSGLSCGLKVRAPTRAYLWVGLVGIPSYQKRLWELPSSRYPALWPPLRQEHPFRRP